MEKPGSSPCDRPAVDSIYFEMYQLYKAKKKQVTGSTSLIVVDEADRLQMNSLEHMRSIFDGGDMEMILIGMLGIKKRFARFPQFYSRIGFVHEFRPLDDAEMQELLEHRWAPTGVRLPKAMSVPGHALRCEPETSVTSPLRCPWFRLSRLEKTYIQSSRPWECGNPEGIFQRVWEAREAGFMAFHAFHTLSFPWPVFRGDLNKLRHAPWPDRSYPPSPLIVIGSQ